MLALIMLVVAACGDSTVLTSTIDAAPVDSLTGSTPVPDVTTTTEAPDYASTTAENGDVVSASLSWASASIADRPLPAPVPSGLEIPKLDVDAPVVAMGVDSVGKMDVPGNVDDVAWYEFGASPGEAGSAVLAAHVDMAGAGPGVFFDIDTLSPGEAVLIAFDDGSLREFVVEKVDRIAKSALDIGALFDRTGSARVRLVTCGGDFNPDIRRYDDNVIVTLVPVGQQ